MIKIVNLDLGINHYEQFDSPDLWVHEISGYVLR